MKKPNLNEVRQVVHPRIWDAMQRMHQILAEKRIPHALIGGLAIGAYGFVRATKDVDFLVGEKAFVIHPSGVVTLRSGIPFNIEGVAIDTISDRDCPRPRGTRTCGIPVASLSTLVSLKLKSFRMQDRADLVRVLSRRTSRQIQSIRNRIHPVLRDRFEAVIKELHKEQHSPRVPWRDAILDIWGHRPRALRPRRPRLSAQ
jgi:hypothetical protein